MDLRDRDEERAPRPRTSSAADTPGPQARLPLSPEDMLVFAAVAREGGVRRGALLLNVSRSKVSRQLAALERALGGRLVSRSTRRFALTEMGQGLMDQCARLEEVLKTTERVLARAVREPSGTLTVAASVVVGEELLPGVLAEYLVRYPNVHVDIRLSSDFVNLRAGVDLAVRTGPLEDADDVFSTKLGVSLKGLYASPAYLKRRGVPVTPEDLPRHDCLVVGAGARAASWSLRSGAAVVNVSVWGPLRVDSYRLSRDAAVLGMGIARIPRFFAESRVRSGKLVPVLEKSWLETTLYAVHTAGRPAPPKIRTFVSLLRDAIKLH
jgi:DNA-binding transcriptional LysR family regulator